jgi:hypothetical protein
MYFTLIKWWVIKLLLSLAPTTLWAQLQQSQFLEIPLTRNEITYDVLSVKRDGAVLHRMINYPVEGLQLIYVDTSFRQKWTGVLPVEKKFQLIQQKGVESKSFFLFYKSDFSDINFQLYQVDLSSGSYSKTTIRNFIPFLPTHLEITTSGALIGGYFLGRIPVILFYDFATGKTKVLPGLFNETGELIQIHCNADDSFSILISAKNVNRQKTLWIKNYTATGDLINNAILQPEDNSSLLFGRIINPESANTQLIAGVYGSRNSEYSKGIYLARIDANQQHVLYYPFADLENFFKYMKAKREMRVKGRIERKKIKGKKIRFGYRFLVHEFKPYNGEYILLGEAFYPRYKSIERSSIYSMSTGSDQSVFDGYQYTHAIILGFDVEGKLLWDNSFEINDVRSFTLEQFVKMDVQDDKIALLYLFDDQIRSKLIQDNDVVEGKIYNQLNMQFDESHSSDNISFNKLEYWYDDRFLAYGTRQTGTSRFGRSGRKVFFINKLRYQ